MRDLMGPAEWIDSTCHPGSAMERDIGRSDDGEVRQVLRCTHPYCGAEFVEEQGFHPIEIRRQVRAALREMRQPGHVPAGRSWWGDET